MAKILIVEDDRVLRKHVVDKFNEAGYIVFEAGDGESGLATAIREHPALIMLDVILPKMLGLTVLKKLREDEWGKSVPVIFLTNLSDDAIVAEAKKNGAHDFLIKKDWTPDEVEKIVRDKLSQLMDPVEIPAMPDEKKEL